MMVNQIAEFRGKIVFSNSNYIGRVPSKIRIKMQLFLDVLQSFVARKTTTTKKLETQLIKHIQIENVKQ